MTPPDDRQLREPIERWFRHYGVPHFAHRYSGASRAPDLLLLLCAVFAFELGAAPWLEPTASELIVAQVSLIGVTLAVLPLLRALFDLDPSPPIRWWSWVIRALVLVLAALLLEQSTLPPAYSNPWVNFAVLFVAFAACTVLFSRSLWAHGEQSLLRFRKRLVALLVGGVVLFGLEGSAFASFDEPLSEFAFTIDPSLYPVPQGVPALALVGLLLILARRLANESRRHELVDPLPDRTVAFFVSSVPLLLLVLAGETAVLPHVADPGLAQAMIPLSVMLALLVVAMLGVRLDGPATAIDAFATRTRLIVLMAFLFVFAYPAIVWKFLEVDTFGTVLSGFDAFLLTAGLNLAALAIAWLVVAGGLDRIGLWAAGAAWTNKRSVAEGMVRGLPLLAVFTAFLVMQAELWEVVVEASTEGYWLLVGLIVVLTIGFTLVASARQLVALCTFDDWKDVKDAALTSRRASAADPDPGRLFARRLKKLVAVLDPPELPDSELKGLKRLNALALITVYQTLVFAPVTIASALLCYALGRLVVPASVAGEWVYGDNASESKGATLSALPFFEQPWTRVAIVLGVFSALYLATQVLSNGDQRKDFFEATDRAIRQRLAVRIAYLEIVPPDPERDKSLWDRWRGLRAVHTRRSRTSIHSAS
jgi:hypothetical protein